MYTLSFTVWFTQIQLYISFFQFKILSNIFNIGTLCCSILYMDKLIFRFGLCGASQVAQ